MNKSSVLLGAAAWATLLFVGAGARADSIPWGYSASSSTIYNSNNPIKTSSIAFSGASGVASGDSGIIIYNPTASSTAVEGAADSFSSVPFGLAVTLTDVKATGSASAGAVSSSVVSMAGLFNATNVTTKSLLPGLNSFTTPMTAAVILGGDDVGWRKYTLTVSSFTPPGQPGGAPGSIQAIVQITPERGPGGNDGPPIAEGGPPNGPPSAAPEPTSLLLAGVALPLVVLYRRRLNSARRDAASKTPGMAKI